MKTIYLIGGSGFIGKNMVRCLHNQYKILVVDKFIDSDYLQHFPDVDTLQLDLATEMIPNTYSTPDFIINLASIVTAERDLGLFDGMIQSNLRVLLQLYERFANETQLKLFIQFGSSEEYGALGSPFTETMREQPNSPYALVKQLTTNTALMLHQNYGFPAAVVRPGNLFGPLQHNSKFIPYVLNTLHRNEVLNVTPCEQKRDFIFVDDFSALIELVLQNYTNAAGQVINVSSGESTSLKSIIEHCKLQIGSKSIINYGAIPYRENEVMDLKCDVAKLEHLTNTKIKLNIKECLNELIKQSIPSMQR